MAPSPARPVVTALRDAAKHYAEDFGWAVHPLVNDDNGFPKKAVTPQWQTLTPSDWGGLAWDNATGIGIIGGSNSGGIAFIDVDDNELAAEIAAYIARVKRALMAWTARRRIHVYVQEPTPSPYRKGEFMYHGHIATVEFRAQGSYVAAPPSGGYTWLKEDWEPLYGTLADVWSGIVRGINLVPEGKPVTVANAASAGYPKPWQAQVGAGERNQSIYIEAHKLREAGMTPDEAIEVLRIRFERHYAQGGMNWREAERTIRSAYMRGEKAARVGGIGLE